VFFDDCRESSAERERRRKMRKRGEREKAKQNLEIGWRLKRRRRRLLNRCHGFSFKFLTKPRMTSKTISIGY
jgi:hypothetical protein